MKKSLQLALAAGLACIATGGAMGQTFSTGAISVPITDAFTEQKSIDVVGGPTVLGDVDVRINITHTFDADLDIVLIPPGGTEYVHLCSDVGGAGDNFADTIFDQQAGTAITAGVAPFAGSYRPEGGAVVWSATATIPLPATALADLNSLNGRDSNGTWTLMIDDDAGGDVGTLNEWALILLSATSPIPPSGVMTLTPNNGAEGTTFDASVTVQPGANPVSTNLAVSLDANNVFGGTVNLLDNGVFPDAFPGDNVFTGTVTVGAGAPIGVQTLTATISDAEFRSATATATYQVRPQPAANDTCDGATLLSGFPNAFGGDFIEGNALAIEHPMACSTGGATNAGYSTWYKIIGAGNKVRISTSFALAFTNNVPDTVVAIYESTDGSCFSLVDVDCDDDDGDGLQSDLTTANALTSGTTYYVQVAKWALGAPAAGAQLGLYVEEIIPEGACCMPGSCAIMSAANCASAGGTYLGDDTTCTSNDGYADSGSAGAFEDIEFTGTFVGLTDDSNVNVFLGFNFPFYGNVYSDIFIGSNGLLTFGVGSNVFGNTPIPSAALPNNALYPLWDDLNPATQGSIVYQTLGTAGVDLRFIVQYTNVPQFGGTGSNTFQAVLFENGDIEYRYLGLDAFAAGDVTVGFENADGTLATSYDIANVAFTGVRVSYVLGGDNCAGGGCPWETFGCTADQDGDDDVDSDDIVVFFTNFENGEVCGDQDGDEDVDSDDIVIFFGLFEQGGC